MTGSTRPILAGRRCRLRPFRPGDATQTLLWRQDEATRDAMLGFRGPFTAETEANWVRTIIAGAANSESFAICRPAGDDSIIGYVRLLEIDRVSRHAAFGIVVGAEADRGKGIGSEATALMIRHGFDALGLRRIYLRVLAGNAGAAAVYTKLGFATEGRLREHEFRGGRFEDVILMGLLAGERARLDDVLR